MSGERTDKHTYMNKVMIRYIVRRAGRGGLLVPADSCLLGATRRNNNVPPGVTWPQSSYKLSPTLHMR